MNSVLLFASVIAVFVNALMALVKTTVDMPKNIIPLVALVVGVVVGGVAYPFTNLEFVLRLWAGGIAGLTSVGLFEVFNKREGTTKE
ncbi:holin [Paenibacillus sp. MZ04-78.2]|uniref:holin n=1 Tax=Paenibacillus sp. MZ04-78.2 TaxID=2962034 RepID=UPI0020B6B272|nr:holin [Paenibacillus sp. MZ04-78.2]MCP3775222.1 holin [Paenibacillus sp. MZ04-78.2]